MTKRRVTKRYPKHQSVGVVFSVWMRREMRADLDDMAAREERSRGDVIRRLIRDAVEKQDAHEVTHA